MKFKVGQQVVCVAKNWVADNGHPFVAPKNNEIVTCAGYRSSDYIFLQEYPYDSVGQKQAFIETAFEPLMDISELEEVLNQQTVEV